MRAVLDTNVLVSALLTPGGVPDIVYQSWRLGKFNLVKSDEQLEEFKCVTRYRKLRPYIEPALAGTMVNELGQLADVLIRLPHVDISRDPADNFLLAMSAAGKADYLVTGDKRDRLKLRRDGVTMVISVSRFAEHLLRS